MAARSLGLTAISEGAGKNRHTVVWKALTETKIDEQLRAFANNSDAAVNRLELPPASGSLRYFTYVHTRRCTPPNTSLCARERT